MPGVYIIWNTAFDPFVLSSGQDWRAFKKGHKIYFHALGTDYETFQVRFPVSNIARRQDSL